MSTPKSTAPVSGLGQGGISTAWRLTVESETLKPQTYGELIQRYGSQLNMWDLLMLASKTTNISARSITVLEEGAILDTLDVSTEVATSAAGADITVVSAKSTGRVGFTVHIPAAYVNSDIPLTYLITAKTGSGPYTYTLKPMSSATQVDVAIPVSTKLILGASLYAPGTQQPASMKRSYYSHTHKPRIMKETVEIEGGQNALQEWSELSKSAMGTTLLSRTLNEAEFRLRVQMNDHLLMGVPNANSITGTNKLGETNTVLSDYGLVPGMYAQAMKQYYAGTYTKENFDTIKFLLASQGVGAGRVQFMYGQELGLSIENSGLEFIREFSGGTDLYSNLSETGFVLKKFTKNGVTNFLVEIPEFSNPLMYGATGYNFETMGFIFPDVKVTATLNSMDQVGRAVGAAEKKSLSHVTLGYLDYNGENRKLVVGDAAGVNAMGLKFTNDYDQMTWYMLSEMAVFLLALNQSILVLKTT